MRANDWSNMDEDNEEDPRPKLPEDAEEAPSPESPDVASPSTSRASPSPSTSRTSPIPSTSGTQTNWNSYSGPSPMLKRKRTASTGDLTPTASNSMLVRLKNVYECENGTWEHSPPPPKTPVDRTKGILRYRELGEVYSTWNEPPKKVKFADGHRTRFFEKQTPMRNFKLPRRPRPDSPDPKKVKKLKKGPAPADLPPNADNLGVTAKEAESAETVNSDAANINYGACKESTDTDGGAELSEADYDLIFGNSETTQGLYQNSEEEIVSNLEKNLTECPLFPDLVCCEDSVESIIPELTPPQFSDALLSHFAAYGITTIGKLSSLKPSELQPFPMTPPKTENAKNVLRKYHGTLAGLVGEEMEFIEDDDDFEEYIEVTSDEEIINDDKEEVSSASTAQIIDTSAERTPQVNSSEASEDLGPVFEEDQSHPIQDDHQASNLNQESQEFDDNSDVSHASNPATPQIPLIDTPSPSQGSAQAAAPELRYYRLFEDQFRNQKKPYKSGRAPIFVFENIIDMMNTHPYPSVPLSSDGDESSNEVVNNAHEYNSTSVTPVMASPKRKRGRPRVIRDRGETSSEQVNNAHETDKTNPETPILPTPKRGRGRPRVIRDGGASPAKPAMPTFPKLKRRPGRPRKSPPESTSAKDLPGTSTRERSSQNGTAHDVSSLAPELFESTAEENLQPDKKTVEVRVRPKRRATMPARWANSQPTENKKRRKSCPETIASASSAEGESKVQKPCVGGRKPRGRPPRKKLGQLGSLPVTDNDGSNTDTRTNQNGQLVGEIDPLGPHEAAGPGTKINFYDYYDDSNNSVAQETHPDLPDSDVLVPVEVEPTDLSQTGEKQSCNMITDQDPQDENHTEPLSRGDVEFDKPEADQTGVNVNSSSLPLSQTESAHENVSDSQESPETATHASTAPEVTRPQLVENTIRIRTVMGNEGDHSETDCPESTIGLKNNETGKENTPASKDSVNMAVKPNEQLIEKLPDVYNIDPKPALETEGEEPPATFNTPNIQQSAQQNADIASDSQDLLDFINFSDELKVLSARNPELCRMVIKGALATAETKEWFTEKLRDLNNPDINRIIDNLPQDLYILDQFQFQE